MATMRALTWSSSALGHHQRDHDLGRRRACPSAAARLDRALEDGARLHLGDLRIGDGEPHAAEAEHRVELVQLGRAALELVGARRPWPRPTSAISASVCGRNSCSGGSSRRMVTGRPAMMLEQARRSRRAASAAAWRARRGVRPRRRRGSSRARRRCGRPRRTCARCGRGRCPRRRSGAPSRASAGVSALARTFMRRSSSAQPIRVANSPDNCGSSIVTAPRSTWPVAPSIVIDVAALQHEAAGRDGPGRLVDAQRPGA